MFLFSRQCLSNSVMQGLFVMLHTIFTYFFPPRFKGVASDDYLWEKCLKLLIFLRTFSENSNSSQKVVFTRPSSPALPAPCWIHAVWHGRVKFPPQSDTCQEHPLEGSSQPLDPSIWVHRHWTENQDKWSVSRLSS